MEEYPEILRTRFDDWTYQYRKEAFKEFLRSPLRVHKESPTVKEYVEITDEELERMIYGEITVPERDEPDKFSPGTDLIMDDDKLHINTDLEKHGIIITDMRTALVKHKELIRKYVVPHMGKERIEFLINSSWQNGIFIYVPKNTPALQINSEIFSKSTSSFAFKSVFICEEETNLNLTETYKSTGGGNGVHGKTIYFFIGNNAKVQYNYLQDKETSVTDVTYVKSFHEPYAAFNIYHINHGGNKVLFSNESQQLGDWSDFRTYGVSFSAGDQKIDIRDSSFQAGVSTNADIQVRGVVTGRSSTMHRGNVDMEEESVKSNGFYDSKIVLLSKLGYANTKPALMIKNNDTRSKHGSAISSVDKEQVLYLRSRGIPLQMAQNMITEGFVSSLIEKANNKPFTERIHEYAEGLEAYVES